MSFVPSREERARAEGWVEAGRLTELAHKAIHELQAKNASLKALVRDLWFYAAREELSEISEEEAAAEGDTFHDLYRRVKDVLKGG